MFMSRRTVTLTYKMVGAIKAVTRGFASSNNLRRIVRVSDLSKRKVVKYPLERDPLTDAFVYLHAGKVYSFVNKYVAHPIV